MKKILVLILGSSLLFTGISFASTKIVQVNADFSNTLQAPGVRICILASYNKDHWNKYQACQTNEEKHFHYDGGKANTGTLGAAQLSTNESGAYLQVVSVKTNNEICRLNISPKMIKDANVIIGHTPAPDSLPIYKLNLSGGFITQALPSGLCESWLGNIATTL